METYRRRLPHIHPPGKWLFVTCHLHGSIPQGIYPPKGLPAGRAFVWIDRFLDTAQSGPMHLRMESVARVVFDALHRGEELGSYELGPFVIMANHIHLLLLPKIEVPKLMKSLKGFTSREANRILGRTGEPFWQSESYDHYVRNPAEFERIRRYIEANPVKAGMAPSAGEYRWSSAWRAKRSAGIATGEPAAAMPLPA